MRIAFFVHRFPVVSEAFIMNAAIGLTRAGHEVDIYALHGHGDAKAAHHGALSAHAGRWRQRAFKLREQPRRRLALAPLAAAKLLTVHGAKVVNAWDARRFGADGPNLTALHEANVFRRRGRYDILHCQFGTLAEPVLNHREAGFLAGKVFVHFRGYDISSHLHGAGVDAYRSVFARADGFFTNCDFFRRRLADLGAPLSKTTIIPSAVDLDGFAPKALSYRHGERLKLLCVGRLVEKKGFTYAIRALAGLVGDGVDAECLVIGDGPLRASLENESRALGVYDRVRFAGAAPHEAIAEALGHAHILLAPSVTAANGDQDASINTLKEAMAAERPFVTTAHGGIPEMVDGVDAGIVVAEGDAEALRAGVQRLLARVVDWPAMGARGRAHIAAHYSIDAATELALNAYHRALTEPEHHRERRHA